jgi:hypothetical protein
MGELQWTNPGEGAAPSCQPLVGTGILRQGVSDGGACGAKAAESGPARHPNPSVVSFLELDNLVDQEAGRATAASPIPNSALDQALTAQIVVAWAGEGGEDPRLRWWRTDLISEFGGEDLFRRLLPQTWEWALLQAVREAARRKDEELRRQSSDADRLVSLYRFGFELDERIEERLQAHKRSGRKPHEALPDLFHGMGGEQGGHWSQEAFLQWVEGHGTAEVTTTPSGRLIKGQLPGSLDQKVHRLVAALAPLGEGYPLPHFRGET